MAEQDRRKTKDRRKEVDDPKRRDMFVFSGYYMREKESLRMRRLFHDQEVKGRE